MDSVRPGKERLSRIPAARNSSSVEPWRHMEETMSCGWIQYKVLKITRHAQLSILYPSVMSYCSFSIINCRFDIEPDLRDFSTNITSGFGH